MRAFASPDRASFTIGGPSPAWSGTYPVEELPTQLAFYRGLRDRKGGRYGFAYAGTVMALEALQREIRADRRG